MFTTTRTPATSIFGAWNINFSRTLAADDGARELYRRGGISAERRDVGHDLARGDGRADRARAARVRTRLAVRIQQHQLRGARDDRRSDRADAVRPFHRRAHRAAAR